MFFQFSSGMQLLESADDSVDGPRLHTCWEQMGGSSGFKKDYMKLGEKSGRKSIWMELEGEGIGGGLDQAYYTYEWHSQITY